jgi:hypothetical protein
MKNSKNILRISVLVASVALAITGLTAVKSNITANALSQNVTDAPLIGNDGYFQGGWSTDAPLGGAGTINYNGTSRTGGLTGTNDRVHFGTAGTVADGGKTSKGWRVLGVGDIPTEALGDGVHFGYTTNVPSNSALILADDQNGVGNKFNVEETKSCWDAGDRQNESCNYFDSASKGRSVIANTSDSFLSAPGSFSSIEKGSLLYTVLNGVCNNDSGCSGNRGTGTSVNAYKLFPLAMNDIMTNTGGASQDGKFFTKGNPDNITNAGVATTSPINYWLRSNDEVSSYTSRAYNIQSNNGQRYASSVDEYDYGFRPAGLVDLNSVLLTERLTNATTLKGGEVPLSRWTGSTTSDKKLVLKDNSIDRGTIHSADGTTLNQDDTVTVVNNQSLNISRLGGSAYTNLAYKLVSRGEEGDPVIGTVIGAGENTASGITVPAKYNFWNNDKTDNLPVDHTYDLYLWAQSDSNSTSDTGSAPLKLTLSVINAPASAVGSDGYFQGGWKDENPLAGPGTINMNGTSGEGGLTGANDRVHFGTAVNVSDGGKTHKGWRVLGVGSISTDRLGEAQYRGDTTNVPENSVYILADDQNGVGGMFSNGPLTCVDPDDQTAMGCDYFDYEGGKNTVAETSESFLTTPGNFLPAEQGALLPMYLNGVCTLANGCSNSRGFDISINAYKLFPMAVADVASRENVTYVRDGKFFNKAPSSYNSNAPVATTTPAYYWLRSPDEATHYSNYAMNIKASDGTWYGDDTNKSFGFRPAGILNLNNVLLTERLTTAADRKGGEIPLSGWTGAVNGDKKLVVKDSSMIRRSISVDNGLSANNGSIANRSLTSDSTLSVTQGGKLRLRANSTVNSVGDHVNIAYKLVSRGGPGDPAAGTVVEAGEGEQDSLVLDTKYNFWNSDRTGNLPIGNTYDLYIWDQINSNTTSERASEPVHIPMVITSFTFSTEKSTTGPTNAKETVNLLPGGTLPTKIQFQYINAFGSTTLFEFTPAQGGSNCIVGGTCIFDVNLGFDGLYTVSAQTMTDGVLSGWVQDHTPFALALPKKQSGNPFKDIAGATGESQIISVYEYGVTSGSECTAPGKPVKQCTKKGDRVYLPNNPVTRAQMSTFLYNTAGSPAIDKGWDFPFDDVPSTNGFKEYIRWLVHTGITSGTDATHYSPNKSVTREQMVGFLYRLAGSPAVSSTSVSFKDVSSSVFKTQIAWASQVGITSGYTCTAKGKPTKACTKAGDTVFQPSKSVTRAQMATFLMAFLDRGQYLGE